MSATFLYFAYGSNMYAARLRYRVPSCRFRLSAQLLRHRLCFHKRSSDGSGKCNAFATAASKDTVFGVVYGLLFRRKACLGSRGGSRVGLP